MRSFSWQNIKYRELKEPGQILIYARDLREAKKLWEIHADRMNFQLADDPSYGTHLGFNDRWLKSAISTSDPLVVLDASETKYRIDINDESQNISWLEHYQEFSKKP